MNTREKAILASDGNKAVQFLGKTLIRIRIPIFLTTICTVLSGKFGLGFRLLRFIFRRPEIAPQGDLDDIDRVVKEALNAFDRIDILVNNAGITRHANIMDITVEDWDRIHRVNGSNR